MGRFGIPCGLRQPFRYWRGGVEASFVDAISSTFKVAPAEVFWFAFGAASQKRSRFPTSAAAALVVVVTILRVCLCRSYNFVVRYKDQMDNREEREILCSSQMCMWKYPGCRVFCNENKRGRYYRGSSTSCLIEKRLRSNIWKVCLDKQCRIAGK